MGEENKTDVTMRRVRESLLLQKRKKYYLLVCLCVRVCAFVYLGSWELACACAYAHVAFLIQHATRMRHTVTSFVVPPVSITFFDIVS
jgi:hypothetical protein